MWVGAVAASTAFSPNVQDRNYKDDCHSGPEDILNLASDSFFVKWDKCIKKTVFVTFWPFQEPNFRCHYFKPPCLNEITLRMMHWRKKCNILSHTAHLKHHSLLKWKFVVIHAASMGEAEPWESSPVNTSLNGPTSWCLLVILWEIHKSNKPKQNTYMHLQLSSRLPWPRPCKHLGISIPVSLQSSDNTSKQLRYWRQPWAGEARKQKNGFHLWRRRRGACFTDMAGE